MLALNRQLIKANARVTQGNYSLSGLVGFDMHGKTVGVIGTGKIGRGVASILLGMVKCWRTTRPSRSPPRSPVRRHRRGTPSAMPRCHASLPSDPATHHLMNAERLALMSRGSMLVNTSRGALVDTSALADALDRRRVACAGLDVYEGEAGVFFEDMSEATDEIPGASVGGAWDFRLADLAEAERHRHAAPGVSHRGGAREHRRDNGGKPAGVREGDDRGGVHQQHRGALIPRARASVYHGARERSVRAYERSLRSHSATTVIHALARAANRSR